MVRKKQTVVTLATVFACLLFIALPNEVKAQRADVRDSQSATPGTAVDLPGAIMPVPEAISSVNERLFNQLQILQQEVLELRGQVEQQDHEIKKLKQQRLEDYLDLDRRIGEVNKVSPQVSSHTTGSSGNSDSSLSAVTPGITGQLEYSEDEKERYRRAIDQVLKQQDYRSAQAGFSDYLARYPQGYYTPNVYYWQGEIFLLQDKIGEATTAFTTLVAQYPNHGKVPDAKYKLAKVYFQQGKKDDAKRLLEEVVQSAVDVSRLAQSFLDSNY